jgi:hypothetical protein
VKPLRAPSAIAAHKEPVAKTGLSGHLLLRGKRGIEAFDAANHSLGAYPDLKTAAAAISAKGRS